MKAMAMVGVWVEVARRTWRKLPSDSSIGANLAYVVRIPVVLWGDAVRMCQQHTLREQA
jgi:hypothetical protein